MLYARILITCTIALFFAAGCISQSKSTPIPASTTSTEPAPNSTTSSTPTTSIPLKDAKSRLTKKTFGIYIDPAHSPVSPERFKGFHTGLDFETTSQEQAQTIAIHVICTGPVIRKSWVSGYGGLAIQSCRLNNQDVTVLYGHLQLTSITSSLGTTLTKGDAIGNLGKGQSQETDQERKHLHLSIHKGHTINVKGYVQTQKELDQWLDPTPF